MEKRFVKNRVFSIDGTRCCQKSKQILKSDNGHPLEVLNLWQSECTEQNENFDAQKFFMSDYIILDKIFNEVIHEDDLWFFTQLYWIGVIKCFKVEECSTELHRMINKNPLLQTATIIALFEECLTSTIDTTIASRSFDNINTFIVSSGTKFPYDNLIKFYITQFIKNKKMQNAIKQSKKGNVVVKLLKIFKCSNIGDFPDNWEELFLPKPEALEENENPFNNIQQIDNVLNPPNNNGVQEHNIPNPPRNNTWGKKELILSTIPGIALLFLSRFLKTAPIEMKQKIRWSGFISLISFPAITSWVSNRR